MRKNLLTTLLSSLFVVMATAQVPFEVTTISNGAFAEGTKWYTMRIGAGGAIISDNAGADHIAVGRATTEYADADLWCFTGDATNGYKLHNKQAGATKVLASSKTMGKLAGYGGTGGSTYPILYDADAVPEGYISSWDFASSDDIKDADGYYMRLHGTNYAVNNFGGIGKLAFWAEGADVGSTIVIDLAECTLDIFASQGVFTSSNANKTWHAAWESSVVEGFTLRTSANNMTVEGDCIAGYSGTSYSSTYTLTAPEGFCVYGYSFDFSNHNGATGYSETLSVDGKTYTSSASAQHVEVTGLEERIATFTQTGANRGVTFYNFKVVLKRSTVKMEPIFEVFPTRSSGAIPYRIPAIATASNGDVIAVADYRHSRTDIGMANNGRIDLHARISEDNGATWGEIFPIVEGKGASSPDFMHVGFGDPCICADRESPRVIVMSCAGNVSFPNGTRNNHQNIALFYSEDYGRTWSEPVDIAPHIYEQFDNCASGPVRAMFVGSGKISQSKYIKVGEYYRLYCAVLVKDVNGTHVNFALYSDDFGTTWKVLGGADVVPIPSGADEPKADELPDGSVLISSRVTNGRHYNIFTYTDAEKAEGSWGSYKTSNPSTNGISATSNSTNGEIMCVPVTRKSDGKDMFLLLQSVPFGPNRANVGIYYKELETLNDFITPDSVAWNWDGEHQSSYLSSAYSTFCLQKDGTIGFLYEEDTYGTNGGGYTIAYKNYSVEYITDSAYVYKADVDPQSVVVAGIDAKTASFAGAGNYVGCVDASAIESVDAAIAAYVAAPSYATYQAVNSAIANLPLIDVVPNAWYRIRNTERSNGVLYLHPSTSRFSVSKIDAADADQLFSFVPTAEGASSYYLYNGNYELYLGPLGVTETQPAVLTSTDGAGIWTITKRSTGKSSVVCTNKTGQYAGLHLAGDNTRLVPWTADAPASTWYIEPVDEVTVSINEFATMNLPFAVQAPEGVTAYVAGEITEADGVQCLEIVEFGSDIIPANTPVIVAAAEGDYAFAVVLDAEPVEVVNNLTGVLKTKSVSNVYKLNGSKMVKAASASMMANTAYYTSESTAAELPLVEVPETGIDASAADVAPVKFYDLRGNEVAKPVRGIYITSQGKKVLVK